MINRRYFILILMSIFFCLVSSGCEDEKIYEKSGFVLQAAVEKGIGNERIITLTLPIFTTQGGKQIDVITTKTDSLRSSMEKSKLVSGKMLEGGKLQLLYFSDELAKEGIYDFLDVFERNPETSMLANIVIVDGSPNKMLETASGFKDKPRLALYIIELLDNAVKSGNAPETRIYRFSINYFAEGIDPITTRIRLNGDSIEVTGVALFKEDRLVGELNIREAPLLLAMMKKNKIFEYFYKENRLSRGGSNVTCAILLKDCKRKIKVKIKDGIPLIDLSLDFKGEIDEYSGENNFFYKENIEKFENEIEYSLKSNCENILYYMKSVGSDPIGFGNIIKTRHNKYWDKDNWQDLYSKTNFNVRVNLTIQKPGTIK